MKYKTNDLIIAYTGNFLYLYQVMSCSSENYIIIGMGSDDPTFNHGVEGIIPASHLDTASHVSMAFDRINQWNIDGVISDANQIVNKIDTRHKCQCDKFQVVHFGCRCGGC